MGIVLLNLTNIFYYAYNVPGFVKSTIASIKKFSSFLCRCCSGSRYDNVEEQEEHPQNEISKLKEKLAELENQFKNGERNLKLGT